jgi:ribonuclease VapC
MAIVLDTSVLVAVVLGEADASAWARVMADHAGDCYVGAPTLVEAEIVLEAKQGRPAVEDLGHLVSELGATILPFGVEHASLATAAWRRFGKGRHRASLNYGDCLSYAMAKNLGLPLLFKGDDFSHTDVASGA